MHTFRWLQIAWHDVCGHYFPCVHTHTHMQRLKLASICSVGLFLREKEEHVSTSLFSKALLEVIVSPSSSPPLTGVLKVRPLNTVTVSVSSSPRDHISICTQRLAYAFDREMIEGPGCMVSIFKGWRLLSAWKGVPPNLAISL